MMTPRTLGCCRARSPTGGKTGLEDRTCHEVLHEPVEHRNLLPGGIPYFTVRRCELWMRARSAAPTTPASFTSSAITNCGLRVVTPRGEVLAI